jgi:NAD(P)-dependent dehydrogenase (short-subunit alcohol dehydrogenase family)
MSASAETAPGASIVVGVGGIGGVAARLIAQRRVPVVLADVNIDLAEDVAAAIRQEGGEAQTFRVDSLDPASVDDFMHAVAGAHSRVDSLVVTVGGWRGRSRWVRLHECEPEEWAAVVEFNLTSTFLMARAGIRLALAQGQPMAIVAVGSLSGHTGSPMHAAYGASKIAVAQLAQTVAIEYGHQGVRMNIVTPGRVQTDATSDTLTSDHLATLHARIPAGRLATPGDIASAIDFLASPASSYMTGAEIVVDGGASVRFPLPLPGTRPDQSY